MHEPTPILWDASGQLAVLTFDLDRETFAIEAVLVREILDLLPETAVPGASPLVGSVVNFRGRIIPIADLRLAFGMPRAEATVDSRIIVTIGAEVGKNVPVSPTTPCGSFSSGPTRNIGSTTISIIGVISACASFTLVAAAPAQMNSEPYIMFSASNIQAVGAFRI